MEECDGSADVTEGTVNWAVELDPVTSVVWLDITAGEGLMVAVAVVGMDVRETVGVFIN